MPTPGCQTPGRPAGIARLANRRLSQASCEGFGATSLKEELVERFTELSDAASFRHARHVLQHNLGGAIAICDELQVAGCLDGVAGMLSTDRPSQIFARIAAGEVIQENMDKEQSALGEYQDRFQICCNRIENDLHWDSTDPKWVEKSSMARRHRFLTVKDLHWQWFNALVFGLAPPEVGGVPCQEAFARVEAMKAAALHYARQVGGWSDQIGLYVNVFGHNSVNCLFIHILDMAHLGPSFEHFAYKNLSLDLVLQVLAEEASAKPMINSVPSDPGALSKIRARKKSISSQDNSRKSALVISGIGGATSMKAEIAAKMPDLNSSSQYRLVRRTIETLGGQQALFNELFRAGLVSEDGQLTTAEKPFNLFARCAAGCMEQPGMAEEQVALGSYQDRWMVCRNRPENDDNWDSEESEWLGRASMSRRHRFLTTKDLHWQWFNAVTFGIVPPEMGGVGSSEALDTVEEMKAAALTYCANVGGWSDNIGLFFHVFGHNSVNSLHLHILDLQETGPTFNLYAYKNMPLDVVLKVLKEEAIASETQGAELTFKKELTFVEPFHHKAAIRSQPDSIASGEPQEDPLEREERQRWKAQILELNVGGTHMTTRRSTFLIAPEGSLLRSMFDGTGQLDEESAVDVDDRIFLDLPPDSFKVILNRMRTRRLAADERASHRDIDPELRQIIILLGIQSLFPELDKKTASPLLSCFSWCW